MPFVLKRDRNGNTYWDSYAEGVTLVVESGAKSWELKTGKEGKFALWKLAPGTYHLRGSDPKAHIVPVTPQSVEVPRTAVHTPSSCSLRNGIPPVVDR